ncbi:Predicted phosphohydrolase, MPP superfamily [Raineyella antarctica]|uniref:Predicted phosphohydrolase, MPP superfamily n=1 Tax=Raineyella antarctica TaxID=1577474 RepID=A0A1G6GFH1_9ACTN|nr:metallophosphoesterase [Raineyella antarctica]SDB80762.1 Predicted phosphohydrolase, MPP superfamily [Raineyella antarctica]
MPRGRTTTATRPGWRRVVGGTVLGGAAFGASCLAYAHFIELTDFRLRRFTARLLPPGAAPLRILHVSDIHLLPSQLKKQHWIAELAALEPDLVVSTGDSLSSDTALAVLESSLGPLLDKPGVFVFGSNDYVRPVMKNPADYVVKGPSSYKVEERAQLATEELRHRFLHRGWVDLNNHAATLEVAGHRIEFRGTDDPHIGRDEYASLAGPADPTADLHVGVTHAPYARVLDAMTADGMDLLLAGHTHGGQVCLPVKGALVTNCDLDTARAKGLSSHSASGRTAALHVSAGLGTSPFAPYRFFCPPEATLLTVLPRQT